MDSKVTQIYSYTGSEEYLFDGINLSSGNGFGFDISKLGPGGVGPVPYDGATITIKSGTIGTTDNQKDFSPDTGNKVYYLLTDRSYSKTEAQEIIDLGTEVSMIYSGEENRYIGTFTFSNPDSKSKLYIVWDYTDLLVSGSASYDGKASNRKVTIPLPSNNGRVEFDFQVLSSVSRIQIINGSSILYDSKFVGVNAESSFNELISIGYDESEINLTEPLDGLTNNGDIQGSFDKNSTMESVIAVISSPVTTGEWSLDVADPSLTSFFISTGGPNISESCSSITSITAYHNGSGPIPVEGDLLFSDSLGQNPLLMVSSYFLVSSEATRSGTSVEHPITIGQLGEVTAVFSCDCGETSIPVISTDPLYFSVGRYYKLKIESTNNPSFWNIVSTIKRYILFGEDSGGTFSYTALNGDTINDSVAAGRKTIVYSSSDPTILSGTIEISEEIPNNGGLLPNGMTFDNVSGIIEGIPTESGAFEFEVNADNCFGTSIDTTILITSISREELTPFKMSTENPERINTESCSVTPSSDWDIVFHTGTSEFPNEGDMVFKNIDNLVVFDGNSYWYLVADGTVSLQIDSTGKVIDTYTCP